jgi:hypothetical protein
MTNKPLSPIGADVESGTRSLPDDLSSAMTRAVLAVPDAVAAGLREATDEEWAAITAALSDASKLAPR